MTLLFVYIIFVVAVIAFGNYEPNKHGCNCLSKCKKESK